MGKVVVPVGWLATATLACLSALTACMPGEMSMIAAAGEPAGGATLLLSVRGAAYEIDRWYAEGLWSGEPLVVPRASVPGDCVAARFSIDDAGTPLPVAQPIAPALITAPQPPQPGSDASPCTLRVSYGTFDGQPPRQGLVVAGPGGIVAYAAREAAQPSYYALTPVEAVAEVWLFSLGVLASPVLLPIGIAAGSAEKKKRAKAEASLPQEVAACWRATDAMMEGGGPGNPERRFIGLVWVSAGPEAYTLQRDAAPGPADAPAGTDTRVTLRGGRVSFISPARTLSTDADVECDLKGGQVVTTSIRLRE